MQTNQLVVPGATVTLARFPALLRLPTHVHERACLTVLLEGVMAERIRGRERYCERASVLIKPGLERHDDLFGRNGSSQIIIEPHEPASDLLAPCRSLFTSDRCFRNGAAERLANRLASELQHPDVCTELAASAFVYELMVTLARLGKRVRNHGEAPPAWLRRTHDLLHDVPGRVPSLAELAREAAVHPAHLARAFRSHYGSSVGTFVRRRRIEAASRDLAVDGATIAGVAAKHGFADQSHFTRQFRRELGFTPREFQRRVRSQ